MKLNTLWVALGLAVLSAAASATTLNGTCYYTAAIEPGSISGRVGQTVSLQAKFYTSRAMWNTSGCGTFNNVPVQIVERLSGRVLGNTALIANGSSTYGGQWNTPTINVSLSGFTAGQYELVAYVGYNGWYQDTNPNVTSLSISN